jgi:hypothetical protein
VSFLCPNRRLESAIGWIRRGCPMRALRRNALQRCASSSIFRVNGRCYTPFSFAHYFGANQVGDIGI